jgi:hypothetical protein
VELLNREWRVVERKKRKTGAKMKNNPAGICLYLLGTFLLMGCASLVEKTGRALDGTAFAEEDLAVYRTESKNGAGVRRVRGKAGGEEFLVISPDAMPNLRVKGSLPGEDGSFYLISLDFFCSNITGWNEYTLELSGGGVFLVNEKTALLKLGSPIEPVNITRGKIRREDTRLSGGEALTALRNRHERILALTEWMRSLPDVPVFQDEAEFEKYWKPLLLPELVSPKERPPAWKQENALWVRGEDVSWNTAYTRAVFPEDLYKIRDSGTLCRDWEEALGWIYFAHEWENLFGFLAVEKELVKIK